MSTIVELTFDGFVTGTDMENLNGWVAGDQGANLTSIIDTYPSGSNGYFSGRNCIRMVTTGGLWGYIATSGTYTNTDWRGSLRCTSGSNAYLTVRNQKNFFLPNCYYVKLDGSNVVIGKVCGGGGTQYDLASVSLTHSLTAGITFRILMVGEKMYVWINDRYAVEYDYDLENLCGQTFTSGSIGVLAFSNTTRLGGTRPVQVTGGFI